MPRASLAAAALLAFLAPAARAVEHPDYCRNKSGGCARVLYCDENPKAAQCKRPEAKPQKGQIPEKRVWKWPVKTYRATRASYGYPLYLGGDRAREGDVFVRQRLVSWDQAAAPNERLRYSVLTLDGGERELYADEVRAYIAPLSKRDEDVQAPPGIMDALVLDLGGKGVQTAEKMTLLAPESGGGSGKPQWINDVAPRMGVLVFDRAGDQLSTDGFQALRAYVERAVRDGVIGRLALDVGQLDAADLEKLEKKRGLRIKVGAFNAAPGSLAQAGVVELRLSSAAVERATGFDGWGNDLSLQPGAVFKRKDGSTGDYMDVWLKIWRERRIRSELGTATGAFLRARGQ